MLGTMEDLEKEIDEFQNNIAASGEMVLALKQMTEQIKQQNSEFDMQSKALLSRLDTLPSSVENTAIANNERVRSEIAAELNKSLRLFSEEQEKYITSLKSVQSTIQGLSDKAKEQEGLFDEKTAVMADKIELTLKQLTEEIEKTNSDLKTDIQRNNETIKDDVNTIILERTNEVTSAQEKYIEEIGNVNISMKQGGEILEHRYGDFLSELNKTQENLKHDIDTVMSERNKEVISAQEKYIGEIGNVNASIKQSAEILGHKYGDFLSELNKTEDTLKQNINTVVSERNKDVTDAQAKYIKEIGNISVSMKQCEEALDSKYKDFISTLEKMNISNLYEQNTQLKNELSKRTTVLMIISALGAILGVVGLFI